MIRELLRAGRFSSSSRRALVQKMSARRPQFESLESRQMLANYTWNDAANTLLISLGNNESLTITESAGNRAFALSAGTFTQSGGDTASGSGTSTISLAASDLIGSLTINNSTVTTGTNNVTFSGVGSLSSAAIAVDITDSDAVGTISTTGGFDLTATGAGGITLATTRNIAIGSGTAISTTNGDVHFVANRQATANTGDFVGIAFAGATLTTSGTGNILLEGRGGNAEGYNYGVGIGSGTIVQSTSNAIGAGEIHVDGIGGSGSFFNIGVNITDVDTKITSIVGDITLTGHGTGGLGGANFGVGVREHALVSSTGIGANAAKITIDGIAGSGSGSSFGVFVAESADLVSVDGNISVTGLGGDGTGPHDTSNMGVFIFNSSGITSTGIAAIKIVGTGGSGVDGNVGVGFNGQMSFVKSVNGPIEITAIAGGAASALAFGSKGNLSSTGAAAITLMADSISFADNSFIDAAASTVTLRPRSTDGSVGVNLGGNDIAGQLGLSDAELDRITAKKIVIGGVDANAVTVVGDVTRSTKTDMELISGDDVIISVGQVNTAGGTLLLQPGDSPTAVRPTKAGVDATASTVSFGSDDPNLSIFISGTTVDSAYSQLRVVGTVDLTGVDLALSGGFVPASTDGFTIVRATSVVGQFNGLPEGSIVTFNGVELKVHYTATTVTLGQVRDAGSIIAIGAEAGAHARVKVLDARTHEVITSFLAHNSSFRGGVRVAVADMNGDGQAEIIVAPGAGISSLVKVFDLDGHELVDYRTTAYAGFKGGVFVAAGDVNGDGRVDLITTPGAGLASQVKVFKNRVGIASSNTDPLSNSPIYTFLAFGSSFKGGATVAAGDVTGDGRADIVVGNGPGMSPHVRVFDTSLINPPPATGGISLGPYLYQITPFNSSDRGGVFVAVGDVRGDAAAEIIIGNGVDGRSRVEMYNPDASRFKSFTAYNAGEGKNAPVHVATKSVDLEILTGQGVPGSTGQLRSFNSDGTLNDSIFEGEDDFRFGFFVA